MPRKPRNVAAMAETLTFNGKPVETMGRADLIWAVYLMIRSCRRLKEKHRAEVAALRGQINSLRLRLGDEPLRFLGAP